MTVARAVPPWFLPVMVAAAALIIVLLGVVIALLIARLSQARRDVKQLSAMLDLYRPDGGDEHLPERLKQVHRKLHTLTNVLEQLVRSEQQTRTDLPVVRSRITGASTRSARLPPPKPDDTWSPPTPPA